MKEWRMGPLALLLAACGQAPAAPGAGDGFVTEYLEPVRVMCVEGPVSHPDHLLQPYSGQVTTREPDVTVLAPGGSLVLDFGREIQGGVEIVRAMDADKRAASLRLVLGESVSEALSEVGAPGSTATNEHSVRDLAVSVPWLGSAEYGRSGFRFARLVSLEPERSIPLVAVRAASRYRDIPYLGSFHCSDARLDSIWQTGAYTVHLNMQEYLWDGIKRDRLVWMGDMHPEVMTIGTVFGDHSVVRRSLDFVRDRTPAGRWMNGICSYSLWWIIIQHHLYRWYGDLDYLRAQQPYLTDLLRQVIGQMDGPKEAFSAGRFIDWPSNDKSAVIHAGLQALSVRALEAGAEMARWLGDGALQRECADASARLRTYLPDAAGSGQAAALLSLEGLMDPAEASAIILSGGPGQCTSFMGYYLLEALARSGHYAEAMQLISDYWGRMLDLGATTFWEDFNYEDGRKAARIDEVVPQGQFDIHADGGAWCYVGLRHSLCHGWASGPTAWLSRQVLGIEPLEVGMRKVRIAPHLGDLQWAEGTFPTPLGVISVSHRKRPDGSVSSTIRAPRGVKIIR